MGTGDVPCKKCGRLVDIGGPNVLVNGLYYYHLECAPSSRL